MKRHLRSKLQAGAALTGMACFSASPVLIEIMAAGGLDFVTIDMEHCPTGLETVAHLLRAADAGGLSPLVRVPDLDPGLIGRVLDLGADGIVLPMATAERTRAAVQAARYAPEGVRGACPAVRAGGYLPRDWAAYQRQQNERALVVPLIEDRAGLEQAEEICAIDGADVLFLGPFDLAASLGLDGTDFRHPVLRAALDRLLEAARRHGKHVLTTMGSSVDPDYARQLLGLGVSMLSFSADVVVFAAACQRIGDLAGSLRAKPPA